VFNSCLPWCPNTSKRHETNHCPGQNKGTSFTGKLMETKLTLDADLSKEKLGLRCHMQAIHMAFHSLPGSGDLPI